MNGSDSEVEAVQLINAETYGDRKILPEKEIKEENIHDCSKCYWNKQEGG